MGSYVQIRDVPDETRRALKARASARCESLNSYLLGVLTREAARPTVAEVLERAAARTDPARASGVDALRTARAARDEELAERFGA
jgi:antitoxin FitA